MSSIFLNTRIRKIPLKNQRGLLGYLTLVRPEKNRPIQWVPSSNFEKGRFQAYSHPGAARSFLLGRIAARSSLQMSLPTLDVESFEVRNRENGEPYALYQEEELSGSLSLSHKENFAAAVYLKIQEPIGIDIEDRKPRPSIRSLWTENEWSKFHSHYAGEFPEIMRWSAQEAMFKMSNSPDIKNSMDIELDRFKKSENSLSSFSETAGISEIVCQTFEQDDFILSLASECRLDLITPEVELLK